MTALPAERLPHYDAWRTAEPPENPAKANCAECGLEIYEAQEVWVVDGKILCSDACLMEHIGAIRMTVEEALEP